MFIFVLSASLIFFLLSIFTFFSVDILLRLEKTLNKNIVLLSRDIILRQNSSKKRWVAVFVFLTASFFMFYVLFTGSYKAMFLFME